MVGHNHGSISSTMNNASHVAEQKITSPQHLPSREPTQTDDETGRHGHELRIEERPAGVDLLRCRIPITRRTTLEHIEQVVAVVCYAGQVEQPAKKLAAGAYEGLPFPVFLVSWGLAHHNQARVRIPCSRDSRSPCLVKGARTTRCDSLLHGLQRR